MGHTPGPWNINGDDRNGFFISADVDSPSGPWKLVAEVRDTDSASAHCTREEIAANAQLIATAPDLLKVAKLMRDRLTILANIADCCWNDWEYSYLVDDVIAKAEGRDA